MYLQAPRRVLTYVGHVQAVLLGGVVLGGGDGGHVHAVDVPHGGVAAVEVAAVGPSGSVIWTFLFGPLPANTRGDGARLEHVSDGPFLRHNLSGIIHSAALLRRRPLQRRSNDQRVEMGIPLFLPRRAQPNRQPPRGVGVPLLPVGLLLSLLHLSIFLTGSFSCECPFSKTELIQWFLNCRCQFSSHNLRVNRQVGQWSPERCHIGSEAQRDVSRLPAAQAACCCRHASTAS